jgi:hypothetical protein
LKFEPNKSLALLKGRRNNAKTESGPRGCLLGAAPRPIAVWAIEHASVLAWRLAARHTCEIFIVLSSWLYIRQ